MVRPLKNAERLDVVLRVRLTREQYELVRGASGGRLSEWVRYALLRAVKVWPW